MQTRARTFAFAARFLDPERRQATQVLYAFFRTVDDLVDERPLDCAPAHVAAQLDDWDRWLAAPTGDAGCPLRAALARVLARYAVPTGYLRALILGLRDDLDDRPFETFADLERYAFRVAATVGLAMCHVLGATTRRALAAAAALGIAMQLTNILRDLGEDLARGRVYLPGDELERFNCSRAHLEVGAVDDAFRALLAYQIERARRYYLAGLDGIDELEPATRYPIALAAWLYGRILDKIEDQDYDVFLRRAVVSRPEKVVLAGWLAIQMRLSRPWGEARPDCDGCLGPAARRELTALGVPGFARPVDV